MAIRSSLMPNYETITTDDQKQHARALARIEAHYFKNEVVKPEDSLMNKIDIFRKIPTIIVKRLLGIQTENHYWNVPEEIACRTIQFFARARKLALFVYGVHLGQANFSAQFIIVFSIHDRSMNYPRTILS